MLEEGIQVGFVRLTEPLVDVLCQCGSGNRSSSKFPRHSHENHMLVSITISITTPQFNVDGRTDFDLWSKSGNWANWDKVLCKISKMSAISTILIYCMYCTNTFNSSVTGHRPLCRNERSRRSPVTTTMDELGRINKFSSGRSQVTPPDKLIALVYSKRCWHWQYSQLS